MNDSISRQDACRALFDDCHIKIMSGNNWIRLEEAVAKLSALPSAQPEIVRCVDCVHSDTFPKGADNDMPLKCLGIRYGGVMPDWYCEHAERRTDE